MTNQPTTLIPGTDTPYVELEYSFNRIPRKYRIHLI
jgi:hypothetical protein